MFCLERLSIEQEVAGRARTGYPIGMAYRVRAAVDVELVRIDAESVSAINHLDRIGFVQLPQIDIVDFQAVSLQKPRYRNHRSDPHLVRLDARGHEAAEKAQGLDALLRPDRV